MTNTLLQVSKQDGSQPGPKADGRTKRGLGRVGRTLFRDRLEIGLALTAVAAPFVRPTIAATSSAVCLKAGGLGLVLTGMGLRVWAAGFAGRHTRSQNIEGIKLITAGPYAHIRNPIYFGSVILGLGMVLLIGDRRLLLPCALTFLALYFGLIPAEEEFLSQKFQEEYVAYCRHVPRLFPRLSAWAKAEETPFDWGAVWGEWRLCLILAVILGAFRAVAGFTRK
jgi:protein-S-isoprenylcysteine O-methyltransferase Ste14